MATAVGDRGDHPKRKVNFYDKAGQFSHSADVRWVGKKNQKPHAGDIKKNTKKLGGYHGWEVAD
jgi:hypothetical protein